MLAILLAVLLVAILAGLRAKGTGWFARVGRILGWAGAGGVIGFLVGFFGPMLFAPDAAQGPIVGVFLTGPLGFGLGLIGGAFRELRAHRTLRGAAS